MKLPRSERRRLARLDQIWRDKIKVRDKYTCQVCGATNGNSKVESAHIIPKTFMETRHDPMNGTTLCFLHHQAGRFSCHNNPLWFNNWLKENKRIQFDYLVTKMQHLAEKEHEIIKK